MGNILEHKIFNKSYTHYERQEYPLKNIIFIKNKLCNFLFLYLVLASIYRIGTDCSSSNSINCICSNC